MWQRIKRFFAGLLAVSMLLGLGVSWFLYYTSYSSGTRSGRLIKLSRKGVLFKTWEGQLDAGGLQQSAAGGPEGITSLWNFSVPADRPQLIRALELHQGRPVKLHYEEKYLQFFWLGDTKHHVTRVEPLPR